MVRTFLCLGLLASQLAVGHWAYCRPPDQVVNSPIPSLKEPSLRRGVQPVPKAPAVDRILSPLALQPPAVVKPHDDVTVKGAQGPEDYLTEQTETWNTPAMREARRFVVEFCRRSAQTSPAEAERFLDQLSKLPPAEMQSWLKRYLERRTKISLEREVEQFARQLMVERALNRQEAMRQAFAHVSQLRAEAAAAMRMQQQALVTRGYGYTEHSPIFDPAVDEAEEAIADYAAQAAAAASLPGDLPRDDPRNFIEEEEGVDFGEWATSKDAVPPVQ